MSLGHVTIYETRTPTRAVGQPTTAGYYPVAVPTTMFPGTRAEAESFERGMADLAGGRSKRFKNVKDLIAELNSDE